MQQKLGYKIVGEKVTYCPALQSNTKEVLTNLQKFYFEKFYNNLDFEFIVR